MVPVEILMELTKLDDKAKVNAFNYFIGFTMKHTMYNCKDVECELCRGLKYAYGHATNPSE